MNNSIFHEKLNKLSGSVYRVEEEITIPGTGVFEDYLQHDNVYEDTLYVFSGPGKTGEQIPYTLTVPSDGPWKHVIRVETTRSKIYISYDTPGDQVEAEDVNKLQRAITYTQNQISEIEEELIGSRTGYTWDKLRNRTSDTDIAIVTQPQDQTVVAGTETTFSIEATGTNITYKWQYRDLTDAVWSNFITGASSAITVTPTESWNGRRIRCMLWNGTGVYASEECTLTVTAAN